MAEFTFLLWSNKHSMWWRANAQGYTSKVSEAGRYSRAEAVNHVRASAFHGRVDQVSCMVVAPLPPVVTPERTMFTHCNWVGGCDTPLTGDDLLCVPHRDAPLSDAFGHVLRVGRSS